MRFKQSRGLETISRIILGRRRELGDEIYKRENSRRVFAARIYVFFFSLPKRSKLQYITVILYDGFVFFFFNRAF